MTFAPPSPRFNVSSATRVPCPRDSYVSMPPSSSSGCAVTMIKLARVCSFIRLCQSAVEPRLIGSSCASGEALIEESYGVWAYSAGASRMPSPANRCRLIVGLAEENYPFGDRQRKLALPLQFEFPGRVKNRTSEQAEVHADQ